MERKDCDDRVNAKRGIAIGIAIVLLIVSLSMKMLIDHSPKNSGFWKDILTDTMTEHRIHEGQSEKRIAVIFIDGVISASSESGLFAPVVGYNHAFTLRQIEKVKDDSSVQGLIISVNSPGGGTFESAQIKDALQKLQDERQIPVYVSMQQVAASGGYYISAYADKIFASEETLTGSIGVIMSGKNLSGLYEKIGIEENTIKSGEFKDIGSDARPMTEKDREILQNMINLSYERFVKVVSEGRGIDIAKAKKLADGRIYDGSQARQNGLVDEIGYLEDAINDMKIDHALEDSEVFYYDAGRSTLNTFLNLKIGHWMKKNNADWTKVMTLLREENNSWIRPMYIYRGELRE